MSNLKSLPILTLMTLAAVPTAQAVTFEFGGCAAADNSGLTTCVAQATVVDFNSGLPASYAGDAAVVSGSLVGKYAAPPADTTPYLSVPYASSSGSVTATPGGSYNYFGLYWGSIDDYNSLDFFSGGNLLVSIKGLDVLAAGTSIGNQSAAGSNRYVNFYFGSESFDSIRFVSNNYAFESDNHAYARVPEPGTLALLGLGLMGLGLARRRKA